MISRDRLNEQFIFMWILSGPVLTPTLFPSPGLSTCDLNEDVFHDKLRFYPSEKRCSCGRISRLLDFRSLWYSVSSRTFRFCSRSKCGARSLERSSHGSIVGNWVSVVSVGYTPQSSCWKEVSLGSY